LIQGALEFCILNALLRFVVRFFCFFFGSIPLFPEFKENSKIFYGTTGLIEQLYPVFVVLNFFQNFGCPLIVIPETGTQGTLFVFCYLMLSVFDVKETSSGAECVPLYHLIFPVS
jgi:hypothetical protein